MLSLNSCLIKMKIWKISFYEFFPFFHLKPSYSNRQPVPELGNSVSHSATYAKAQIRERSPDVKVTQLEASLLTPRSSSSIFSSSLCRFSPALAYSELIRAKDRRTLLPTLSVAVLAFELYYQVSTNEFIFSWP